MKSYWMHSTPTATAQAGTLELRDTPVPTPGDGQMLVRVHAAGLNRGEFILGHGLTPKGGAPKAVGMEAAGVVLSCGSGVSGFKQGDRVMGRCPGAFAEFALMEERETMAMPAELSWEVAASVPLTFMVVYDMLIAQGQIKADQWLLVAGVSSGVGVAALLTAKALGAKVIGTSGAAQKLARLTDLGLDLAIESRAPDFAARALEATQGKGVNLVVNAVGGSVFAECVRSMAFEGRLAMVGYVDGVLQGTVDIEALHAKRLTLFGVSNKLRTPLQRALHIPAFCDHILPLIGNGTIKPVVDRVFAFEQLPEAKAMMDANLHLGKIVLKGL